MSVRIFVEPSELIAGSLALSGSEHHYLTRVRRQGIGATLCLLDGQGRWANAVIVAIGSDATSLEVETPTFVPRPEFELTIAPALIKGERMDQAITKMVELGVQRILPITSERTVVKLKGERATSRLLRFQSLCRSAARQSRNPNPASVEPIQSFDRLLSQQTDTDLKLIPEASGSAPPLAEVLAGDAPRSALVIIGPEGGFSEGELARAAAANFLKVGLGQRILRAETACVAIASILAFRFGDVGRR